MELTKILKKWNTNLNEVLKSEPQYSKLSYLTKNSSLQPRYEVVWSKYWGITAIWIHYSNDGQISVFFYEKGFFNNVKLNADQKTLICSIAKTKLEEYFKENNYER